MGFTVLYIYIYIVFSYEKYVFFLGMPSTGEGRQRQDDQGPDDRPQAGLPPCVSLLSAFASCVMDLYRCVGGVGIQTFRPAEDLGEPGHGAHRGLVRSW